MFAVQQVTLRQGDMTFEEKKTMKNKVNNITICLGLFGLA
jgi:hypothetical protein